jgi:hypothetical protein
LRRIKDWWRRVRLHRIDRWRRIVLRQGLTARHGEADQQDGYRRSCAQEHSPSLATITTERLWVEITNDQGTFKTMFQKNDQRLDGDDISAGTPAGPLFGIVIPDEGRKAYASA